MADNLSFHDEPALLAPAPGGVAAFPVHVGGLSTLASKRASLSQQLLDPPQQDCVFGHGDDVVNASLSIEEGEDLGRGESGIETHAEASAREGQPQTRKDPLEDGDRAALVGSVAGSEQSGEKVLLRLVIEGQEAHHGQVTPAVVVAIEEGQLLLSVGGILG